MNSDKLFATQKPINQFLSTIVDYYFYIDVQVDQLSPTAEYIIPFPRITFGYFFDCPFKVTNLTKDETQSVNMIISRISSDQIVVQPQTDRIKILGAHVRPFCLAYLTAHSIKGMPWLINTKDLFPAIVDKFQQKIEGCGSTTDMFQEIERVFLSTILARDLSIITRAIELIDRSAGNIEIATLSKLLDVTDRTIRNQFYDCIGCSPKEYIRLVKIKQVAYQMKYSNKSLANIAYDNDYFDQAHFIHEVRNITGQSPNLLRKEIPHFRFLQF